MLGSRTVKRAGTCLVAGKAIAFTRTVRVNMLNTIGYPRRLSEFEMQAIIYGQLRSLHIDARGCVGARCDDFGKHHKCYFDLVVFDRLKKPVLIIEVKNRKKKSKLSGIGGRQHRRYSKFSVPIVVCDREDDVFRTVDKVVEMVWKKGAFSS